ncbi:MAG: S8 family serine peptidase, partial [Acidimicrobiales bacterium]|nr:S8 family serine peptidase [Acidimicrobiales bacterium]
MKKLKGTPGFVAFVVVCLCGMYLATGLRGGEPQAAAAPAQNFDDSGVYEPGAPVDDGYNRLLVDVPAEPEARTVSSTSEFLTEEGVDLGVLDGQDDSAVIENVDGELVATYPDGSSIVLTADETDEGPGIDAVIAELEADPEVVEVRKIDDQTIAVTTTRNADEIGTMVGLTVNPDEPTEAFETDPYFAYQWGLENTGQDSGYVDDADVDAPDAWATSSRGSGIVVAVLDSGVDFGHPDLGSRRWTNTDENCGNGVDDDANGYVDDCHGWDFMFNDASPWDGNNNFHGTHVAGIIAASNDNVGVVGMAANATIMDVRILDSQGRGYTSAFAAGIRYAVDNGADVINMSVGTNPGVPREYLAPVEAAVQYARANGVVIVAAAGNSNVDVDTQYVWPASFGRYYDNVATIAATDYADSRSSFSNYGAQTVVLGAPGSRILSATLGNNWSYASGTSMAAPMFAGAVALLYGDGLAGSPAEAIEQLVASADPVPSLDGRARNAGRLNVGALYSATPIDPVRVEATGLHSLNAGSDIDASLNIRVNDVEGFAAQEFRWEARLLTAVEGQAHGVLEHPISVNGVDTLTNGQALFALSGNTSLITDPSAATEGSRIDLGTKLPAGSYALIVEAVAADDPTMILAPPSMLFFDVAPEPEVPDTTTPATDGPTTTTEAGVTTTTIAASPTTIAGSPSTTIEDDDRDDDD